MTEKINNKRALAGILMSIVALLVLTLVMEPKLQAKWQAEQLAAVASAMRSEVVELKELPPVSVEAKSAIVYDVSTGKTLYAKESNEQLPLASLTKLVTALVADEVVGQGTKVVVSDKAVETEGESGLLVGDSWAERDLSDFMLTVSSNDAAAVLASSKTTQEQFVAKMNQQTAKLGLNSMVILNESGLDVSEQRAGAYGSARDIALLLTYISTVRPELLEATTFDEFTSVSLTGKRYKALNTNKAVSAVPGLVGGKTGFTDLAGGNLAIVFDTGMGRYVAVVVLGSSKEGRFSDVLKLVGMVI